MIKRIFFLSILIITTLGSATAQKDSLLAALDTATNEFKVKILNELFRATIQADPVKAIGYTREALNLATEIGDKKGMAASYNNLRSCLQKPGCLG